MAASRYLFVATSLCLFASCSTEPTPLPDDSDQRPLVSAQQCQAKGGYVVGDIGDGRVHRDDFLCPNDQPPIGTIQAEQGKRSIEGAVCCLR